MSEIIEKELLDTEALPRNWLLVSGTFKTLQGEGPSSGTPAYFVRLGACNLACTWCDTPYTWAFGKKAQQHESKHDYDPANELARRSLVVIAQTIRNAKVPLCVFTGGEPLLQLFALDHLISTVTEYPHFPDFEIETAGTIYPAGLDTYAHVSFNVSPKLASSGNDIRKRYHPDVLRRIAELGPRARFKFVVDTRPTKDRFEVISRDIAEIKQIVNECGIAKSQTWLMPCGVTAEHVVEGMQHLAPRAIDNGWHLTSRMHTLIWGNERGR